jgi:hypothetical protein
MPLMPLSLWPRLGQALYGLYESLSGPASAYCRLESSDGQGALVSGDGSLVTAIEVEGALERVSPESLERAVSALTEKSRHLAEEPGHFLKAVFEYDPRAGRESVSRCLGPAKVTAGRLGLRLSGLLDGWEDHLSALCGRERLWLVLWTGPGLLPAKRGREAKKERDRALALYPGGGQLPLAFRPWGRPTGEPSFPWGRPYLPPGCSGGSWARTSWPGT